MIPNQPPAPAPTAQPKQKLPGMVGIWIGIILIVGGIIVGIALIVGGARSLVSGVDQMQRIPTTGGTVQVEGTGRQTVYLERFTGQSGTSFSSSTYGTFRPSIELEVIAPSGQRVTFFTTSSPSTYVFNGREGVQVGSFFADTPGDYRINVLGEPVRGYDHLAVGKAVDLGGVAGILGGIFGGGLIVLVGVVILIVSAVRRSKARRRAQGPGPDGGYGYGSPLPGWAPAPMPGPGPGYVAPGAYAPGPYAPPGYGQPAAPGGTWAPPPVAAPQPGPPPAPAPAPAPPAPGVDAPFVPPVPPPPAAGPSDLPGAPPEAPPAGPTP